MPSATSMCCSGLISWRSNSARNSSSLSQSGFNTKSASLRAQAAES
jgi:hypothetical protein